MKSLPTGRAFLLDLPAIGELACRMIEIPILIRKFDAVRRGSIEMDGAILLSIAMLTESLLARMTSAGERQQIS